MSPKLQSCSRKPMLHYLLKRYSGVTLLLVLLYDGRYIYIYILWGELKLFYEIELGKISSFALNSRKIYATQRSIDEVWFHFVSFHFVSFHSESESIIMRQIHLFHFNSVIAVRVCLFRSLFICLMPSYSLRFGFSSSSNTVWWIWCVEISCECPFSHSSVTC